MIALFNTPINSPVIIVLTVLYFICASISTIVIRLEQARKMGVITPDEAILRSRFGFTVITGIVIFLILFFLNWKYAIIVFIIKYVLKFLPVLETIGNFFISPFKPQSK